MSNDYLRAVKRCAEQALVQNGKIARCELHKEVLLHNGDETDLHVVCNNASIWLKDEVGTFMRADVEDAVRSTLDGAA